MSRRPFRLFSRRPRRAAVKKKKGTQLARPRIAPKAHQPIPGVTDLNAKFFAFQSSWFLQKDGLFDNPCGPDAWPPKPGVVLSPGLVTVLFEGRCDPPQYIPEGREISHVKASLPMYGKPSVIVTTMGGKKYRVYSMQYSPSQGFKHVEYTGV